MIGIGVHGHGLGVWDGRGGLGPFCSMLQSEHLLQLAIEAAILTFQQAVSMMYFDIGT